MLSNIKYYLTQHQMEKQDHEKKNEKIKTKRLIKSYPFSYCG